MSKTAFKEFIEKGIEEYTHKKEIDWVGRKDKYLNKVKQLYGQVRSYLKEFSDTVQLSDEVVKVNEKYIGDYDAPGLKIDVLGKQASLIPVGTNIVGTPGRVDLKSYWGTKRIILADQKTQKPNIYFTTAFNAEDKKRIEKQTEERATRSRKYIWKIITDPPNIRYIELDEEHFLGALQEVLGG
jgi:CRISPR/Cas system-associated protein Cas5 (RAMP superfamily)